MNKYVIPDFILVGVLVDDIKITFFLKIGHTFHNE